MLHNTRRKPLPRKPDPEITRHRQRKRMTLIAAFRYQHGFVVVSDSQETHYYPSEVAGAPPREYRVQVDKVKPQLAGDWIVVAGGAGDDGPRIDRCERHLMREITGWQDGPLQDFEIETRLTQFFSAHITAYPQQVDFLICLKHKDEKRVTLWQVRDDVVNPKDSYLLVGWDERIYDHEIRWLFRPGSWLNNAVLMGIRLFTMAEATSNTIKGPFRVVAVDKENGAREYPPEIISELQRRVEPFNEALASVILNASDMSIHDAGLIESFAVFEDEILNLRERFLGRPVLRSFSKQEIEEDQAK